jgi:hypothetical protein
MQHYTSAHTITAYSKAMSTDREERQEALSR